MLGYSEVLTVAVMLEKLTRRRPIVGQAVVAWVGYVLSIVDEPLDLEKLRHGVCAAHGIEERFPILIAARASCGRCFFARALQRIDLGGIAVEHFGPLRKQRKIRRVHFTSAEQRWVVRNTGRVRAHRRAEQDGDCDGVSESEPVGRFFCSK